MKNILFILCALLFCGCASRVVSNFDKVEVIKVDQLVGNNLTRNPFDQKVVYLNARCETNPDGQKKYFLFTEVIAPADFTLQSGDSLILNLNNEVLTFAPTNSPSFNARKRFVTTFYPVHPQVLVALAKTTDAKVRIKGISATIDKELSRRNVELFWNFASKCSLLSKTPPSKAGG